MGSLTLIRLCGSGVDFGVLGVDLSWCDVVMSLLRLQQASDWIPHPYWDVYKVFWYLGMLCMGIWGHPYSDTPSAGRGWNLGLWG